MRLSIRYVNNVTGEASNLPPPDFRGGILADAMGLGKTLSIIALVASTLREPDRPQKWEGSERSHGDCTSQYRQPTLIVVPLSRKFQATLSRGGEVNAVC